LLKSPGLYFRLLWVLLKQPAPEFPFLLKRLVIFLKSVWLAKELKGSSVQSVHVHFAWLSGAAGMILSQLLDLPFTVTAHAYDIYSVQNDLLNLTAQMADHLVTISEYNRQVILRRLNTLASEKITVIRCGIDLDKFQFELGELANPCFEITSVGSLIEKKGHEYLIRACHELELQGINFHCVIVGGGENKQLLQTLIRDLNLEDRVFLVGPQTQTWVIDRLRKSDLFALACVTAKDGECDGIPVVLMEALAMQVPVISTSVSGIPELVRDGETGLLVPERDSSALASAIVCMIQNKSLSQRLAREGRVLVKEDYDVTKNAGQLVALFQRVMENRRK
jgi:glycosyltransferase involved in cell wall biosynthesis